MKQPKKGKEDKEPEDPLAKLLCQVDAGSLLASFVRTSGNEHFLTQQQKGFCAEVTKELQQELQGYGIRAEARHLRTMVEMSAKRFTVMHQCGDPARSRYDTHVYVQWDGRERYRLDSQRIYLRTDVDQPKRPLLFEKPLKLHDIDELVSGRAVPVKDDPGNWVRIEGLDGPRKRLSLEQIKCSRQDILNKLDWLPLAGPGTLRTKLKIADNFMEGKPFQANIYHNGEPLPALLKWEPVSNKIQASLPGKKGKDQAIELQPIIGQVKLMKPQFRHPKGIWL